MHGYLRVQPGYVFLVSREYVNVLSNELDKASLSVGDKPSLMKMGIGALSSPRSICTCLLSVGGSRCSKLMSHNVFSWQI